jgi:hypothetical protein
LKKQARATAAGGRARCHEWLEWRSHRLPSLVLIISKLQFFSLLLEKNVLLLMMDANDGKIFKT